MTSTDTLLPCPFCGGEARLDAQTHMGRNYVGVICLDCGLWQDTRSPDIIGAIAAWNRRTTPPPATEEREAVARALCIAGEEDDFNYKGYLELADAIERNEHGAGK